MLSPTLNIYYLIEYISYYELSQLYHDWSFYGINENMTNVSLGPLHKIVDYIGMGWTSMLHGPVLSPISSD